MDACSVPDRIRLDTREESTSRWGSQWLSYEELEMIKADLMGVQLCGNFTMAHTPLLCHDPILSFLLYSVYLENEAHAVFIFI